MCPSVASTTTTKKLNCLFAIVTGVSGDTCHVKFFEFSSKTIQIIYYIELVKPNVIYGYLAVGVLENNNVSNLCLTECLRKTRQCGGKNRMVF